MTARHHHYIPQCYLKGFTKDGKKDSQLLAIDFQEKKEFMTIPRNVGGVRDFNRIDIDGVEQDALEKSLSGFERQVDAALRDLEETLVFEGETRILILNLIALLGIRSPEMREQVRTLHASVAEKIMDLTLASKERWESQIRKMKEAGKVVNESTTYEEAKRFHENKDYKITVAREHAIHMEFVGVDTILPYLDARNWLLIKATEESGPFITTDNPVNLTWKEPDRVPLIFRNSPGYAMKSTQVYFPVSRNLALIGEFDGHEGVMEGSMELVSMLNSKMLMFARSQIYSPSSGFYFRGRDNEILEGSQLLEYFKK